MNEVIKNPSVLYLPVGPFSTEDWQLNFVLKQIRDGVLDALIVETYMSGMYPSEGLWFIAVASNRIPTFLVPQAPKQQESPRRCELAELCGGIELDTAYSGIAEEVIAKVIEALKRDRNPQRVIGSVRKFYSSD